MQIFKCFEIIANHENILHCVVNRLVTLASRYASFPVRKSKVNVARKLLLERIKITLQDQSFTGASNCSKR